MRKFVIGIILIVIAVGIYFMCNQDISLKENLTAQVNQKAKIKNFIKNPTNIKNKDEIIDTSKVGEISVSAKKKTLLGTKEHKFIIKVIDTIKPKITYEKEINIGIGDNVDLLKNIKVDDNSKEKIDVKIEGEYDTSKEGSYSLKLIAADSSGNKAEETLVLNIFPKEIKDKPYYIKINRKQNVVMIYGVESGIYNKLVKTFVCSTGRDTPLGTFRTTDKYIWRPLVNNVYGQYATRITGSILFHSVPYFRQSKDSLEYEEYNKLGTKASLGCIRLTVEDAKWIYDNCPKGTMVTLYDSDDLKNIKKPESIKIDVNNKNRGWDPTDPDPNNPWKNN